MWTLSKRHHALHCSISHAVYQVYSLGLLPFTCSEAFHGYFLSFGNSSEQTKSTQ